MIAGAQVLLVTVLLLGHCLGEACIRKGQHQQEKVSLDAHAFADSDQGGKIEADRAHAAGAQLALVGCDQ
jgi:hypothetical protein